MMKLQDFKDKEIGMKPSQTYVHHQTDKNNVNEPNLFMYGFRMKCCLPEHNITYVNKSC